MNAPRARKAHLDAFSISLLLACCMFWGFQQVLVKATVAEVAPVFQAFVRFALATVAVAAWCLWSGLRTPVPSAAGAVPSPTPPGAADKASAPRLGGWGPGLLAGALFAGEFACIYVGMQYTTASRLTVFLYGSPFWVALLLPRFIPGERLRGWQWLAHAQQASHVFDGEQQREHPFSGPEHPMPTGLQGRYAVSHHHGHAGQNEHDQRHIKPPPGARIGFKNDGVQAQTPALQSGVGAWGVGAGRGVGHSAIETRSGSAVT